MKQKQSYQKQNDLTSIVSDSCLQQSIASQMDTNKIKTKEIKNDPTIGSLSQNQISTIFLLNKSDKSIFNDESMVEQFKQDKKWRKLNKKKIIEKNIILRSRDRHGKSNRIQRNKQVHRLKIKQKKAQKLKLIENQIKIKQKIIPQANQSIQIKPKQVKILKKDKQRQKINLIQYAQIRMHKFDRKQLQKKRDDLLKRTVQDWNFIQKVRSDKRQLRILNI